MYRPWNELRVLRSVGEADWGNIIFFPSMLLEYFIIKKITFPYETNYLALLIKTAADQRRPFFYVIQYTYNARKLAVGVSSTVNSMFEVVTSITAHRSFSHCS